MDVARDAPRLPPKRPPLTARQRTVNRSSIQVVPVLAISLVVGASACGSSTANEGYFDQCEPGMPPDAECYAKRRDPESEQVALATNIARRWIDEHSVQSQWWDWGPSVLMHSFAELYRVTGHEWLRDYYKAWMDYRIREGYRVVWSDSCPPAIIATSLLSEAPNEEYQQVVDDVLYYLDEVAPRTDWGGISHTGILGQKSIWVDSLFMFGMVLTRWGEFTDDPSRLDMLSEQVGIFSELLQHDNGLMLHAHDWPHVDPTIYWNRGNSWVVASLSDYLRVRLLRGETDREVEQVFRNQVRGAIEFQDPDGLWWSIMNRPDEIYLETSGSALFAYGMARAYRYGFVDHQELAAAQRAVEGVKQKIEYDEQGRPVVTGISLGTDPGDFENYANVNLADDINYGVGAAILALIETSGLPDSERE